ncbi:hypothetical protein [Actinomadura pelletieri]|nr:hypothetical protein [Actinomadura pelletieri]
MGDLEELGERIGQDEYDQLLTLAFTRRDEGLTRSALDCQFCRHRPFPPKATKECNMPDTHLPTPAVWRGLPVPWVVRWTGEKVDPSLRLGWQEGRLAYRRELPTDRRFGALWYRNRTGRSGEPEFAEIHTGRQLACMTSGICQVCGGNAAETDGRIAWLLPGDEWPLLTNPTEPNLVPTPPTCRACWSLAASSCPHLRTVGSVPVTAAAAVPAAAHGDLYRLGQAAPCARNVMVPLTNHSALRRMLAKQLIVELRDIRAAGDRTSAQVPGSG